MNTLRMMKYFVTYYRIYRMNRKIDKAIDIRNKRDILLLSLTSGYVDENEFFSKVTNLKNTLDAKDKERILTNSYEKSRKISAAISKVNNLPKKIISVLREENTNGN